MYCLGTMAAGPSLPELLTKYSQPLFAACDRVLDPHTNRRSANGETEQDPDVDSDQDSAYRRILVVMQVLSCVATSATVFRVIHEQRLSAWFLLLPTLLVATLALRRSLHADTTDLLTGLSTGAMSAFFAEAVGGRSPADGGARGALTAVVSQAELLHIPVIGGSLVLAYCLVFDRWPSHVRSTFLLLVVLSASLAVTIGFMILDETADLRTSWRIFSFVFVTVYICVSMATVQLIHRPWMVCLLSLWLNTYWQSGFFDYWSWDWGRGRFPICGFLVALIFVFFIERTDVPLDARHRGRRRGHFANAVTWFAIAYVVERVTLTLLKTRHAFGVRVLTDVWPCSVLMLAYMMVVSAETTVTVADRVSLTLSCLLLYLTLSLPTEGFCNGFFLDIVLALTVLFATEAARTPDTSRKHVTGQERTNRWDV